MFRQLGRIARGRLGRNERAIKKREHRFEQLERRDLLAAAIWHNPVFALDVTGDQPARVSALDALRVINWLNNASQPRDLPRQVDFSTEGQYVDTSCDGRVNALDALRIINHLNGVGSGVVGGFSTDGGSFAAVACSPQLLEGSSFATELERVLRVPADRRALEVKFQAPVFDLLSEQQIRDAFEVQIVQADGSPLANRISASRSASFNWTEGFQPIAARGMWMEMAPPGQDSTLTFDLSAVPAGTEIRVLARLANNDTDDNTSVIIRGYEFVELPASQPENPGTSTAQASRSGASAVDIRQLSNLTGMFETQYDRTSLSSDKRTLVSQAKLTNVSSGAILGPIVAVFENFSDPNVFMIHPDGFLADGRPYIDLTAQIEGRAVAGGQTLIGPELGFRNESGGRFQYRLSIYGRLNPGPGGFSTQPMTSIGAGDRFGYQAKAAPTIGSPLTYSVVVGPDEMIIDAETGQVEWVTEAGDVGSHQVILRATDEFGLFVEQRFELKVVEELPNRPPNFVTDPVTEAIASSGFEITTVATGDSPSGVAVVSGFYGPRLVTANAGEQTIGVYAGRNNDRFDDAISYSTGEPPPTDSLFDVGYGIDVGLPEFVTAQDENAVIGLDQADFNRDGILDFAVLSWYRWTPMDGHPSEIRFQITRVLGDGNGQFGEPLLLGDLVDNNGWPSVQNLVAADVNDDGHTDVLALRRGMGNPFTSELLVVTGKGDGSFEPMTRTILDIPLDNFRLVDLDQDGILDLIGRRGAPTFNIPRPLDLNWKRGNGDGTFADAIQIDPNDGIYNFRSDRPYDVADLDGDGDLDVVVATVGGLGGYGLLRVYLNDGSQQFTLANSIPAGQFDSGLYTVQIADFTGDDIPDIFTSGVGGGGGDAAMLYIGDGSGTNFSREERGETFLRAGNLAGNDEPVDIDGDGDLDILLGSYESWFPVLTNDGQGNFELNAYPIADVPGQRNRFGHEWNDAVGILAGDYNSDGVMDVAYMTAQQHNSVVLSMDFDFVGIALGTRPGEFGNSGTIPFEGGEYSGLSGDFNGDGIPDLLALDHRTTYLGNGDGSYSEAIPAVQKNYANNSFGYVSDFNQDGLDDFVSTHGASYFVALSNGNGTFEISDDQTAGGFYGYSSFRVADFNQDGYPDFLAKGIGDARRVYVYLNDANDPGKFTNTYSVIIESEGINVSGFLHAFVPGDFNNDGHMDFAAVNGDNNGGEAMRIEIYAGDSTGQFTLLNQFEPFNESFIVSNGLSYGGRIYSGDLDAGDLNADGHLDIVSFTYNGPLVMLGRGDGSFDVTDYYVPDGRISGRERHGFIADVDEDGILDLINVMEGTEAVNTYHHIYLGLGDGTFGREQRFAIPGDVANPLNFADFDGDGHLDLFHSFKASGASYNGQTIAPLWTGTRDGLVDVMAVDLNGDGNEEVLAVNEKNDRLKLFVGDNLGNLTRQRDLLTGRAPKAVTTADLDGDGQLELITANRASRSVTVFTGNLETGYTGVDYAIPGGPIDVAAADIDGNGSVDIIVLDDTNNSLWVFSGNGTNSLDTPIAIPLGDTPKRLELADATGNGQLDAVITLSDSNRVMILGSLGFQPGLPPLYVELASSPDDLKILELNDDGHPDLAVTLPESDVLSVHYGRGNNQFAKAQLISVGDSPTRVTAADADEDGRVDLVVTNSGDSTASVIYNRFDPNQVYRYDADAVDPDDDAITYAIIDGPGGLIINETTGALLWAASPDQVGVHDVTLSADDGRGGIATQSFKIEVETARENASPLIATEPIASIGAGETFNYNIDAVDNDRDTIRYRLLAGPDGAQLDPTTGELTWDGRQDMAMRFDYGSSAISTGAIVVPANESFKTPSVTVEGWFNFHKLLPGLTSLFTLVSTPGNNKIAYQLNLIGHSQLSVQSSGNPELRVPFNAEVDKWFHLALVIDDERDLIQVFSNGRLLGEQTLNNPLEHDPAGNLFIARQLNTTIVDNFRVWNIPRTQNEIVEGMTQQFDGDSRVVIDYRFDLPDTQTVRDFSTAGNDGYRGFAHLYPELVPGLAEVGMHHFTVAVEDGRGGYDEQTFTLEIVPELRGSIIGHLFEDLNGNSVQDDGSEEGVPAESSLDGWHLFIDRNNNAYPDPDELQAVTDANGNYRFDRLLPGNYFVRLSPVAGYDVPTAPKEVTVEVDLAASHDLAIEQLSLSHIRGQLKTEDDTAIAYWKVYADLDGDGTRDENEPMGMSDRSGNYAITGLAAGTYTVRADVPAGWTDVAGREGRTVVLQSDEISSANDFTLKPTNTSVTGGIHFVTMPSVDIGARSTFRYASVAMGIVDQPIAYDLSLAPAGMTVDPQTGQVAWRPAIDQVGEHLVILRATSQSGSIALHDFTIRVAAPNTAPVLSGLGFSPAVFNSSMVSGPNAYVGQTFAVNLQAQDAEDDAISFSLLSHPTGTTLDAESGELRWTPLPGDVGLTVFTIELADERGAKSVIELMTQVVDQTMPSTPFHIVPSRTEIGLLQNYLAELRGSDALGRPLSWTKSSGPSGLSVSPAGLIQWTPGNADLGQQSVTLTATSIDGATQATILTIEVSGFPVNSAPAIDSQPIESLVIGNDYVYEILASDADGDTLVYSLIEGPSGMSVSPSLGTLRWTPEADQRGQFDVTIQVTDPNGESATQQFKLYVSRFGGPPKITSVPPTQVAVGTGYLYTVLADDREGDPLAYRLLTAPAGMTVTFETGEISWTPTAGQLGTQEVVIEVSDGVGGATTQAFVVRVVEGVDNLAPSITNSAPRFGIVDALYSHTITATDPESTSIGFSLGRGPIGMTVDSESGLVLWQPSPEQFGRHVVTLVATDADGASAVESFELDILAENRVPVIRSLAVTEVTAGAEYAYDVLVDDPDRDPLSFSLTASPESATIDSFGRIRWTPSNADIGEHDFSVRVVDARGGQAVESFTVAVVEDTVPPNLSVILRPDRLLVWQNEPYTLYVRANDNVAIESLTLTANGEEMLLGPSGTATFYAEQWGLERIVATAVATDINGNVTERSITFGFNLPANLEGVDPAEIPTAEITTPAQDAAVVGMVSIEGTAAHARFEKYTLSYRRADQDSYTEFLESTTSVTDGELGVWDTSLLPNDHYFLKLDVQTEVGVINTTEISVGLSGELKLGNFQLSFTDMVIPVAGIPIEITRIYDTLYADREGDFGYGWRLEYRNTDLRVSLPKSGLEDIGIYTPYRPGVKVYLNVPGEGRQGFTFVPEIRVLPGFGDNLVLARPRFYPDPGVTSTLSTGVNGYLFMNEFGELHASGGIPYNPASEFFGGGYTVTTRDGNSYRVDGSSGELRSVSDSNGNQLLFSESGISSNTGIQVVLVRDSRGRISEIRDPSGNATLYSYSSSGDLIQSVDRDGNTTQFVYREIGDPGDPHHYLESVIDPLGRTGARAIYGDDGKLSRTVNVNGAAVEFSHDPANSLTRVTDRNGNDEFLQYDNSGRIVTIINAGGFITEYTYDAFGNRTSSKDPEGNLYQYAYDAQGNLIRIQDPLGNLTTRTFDALGNMISSVNAVGHTTTSTYDERGNLLTVVNELGDRLSNRFDHQGNVIESTNANGNSAFSTFDTRGNEISTTDLNGLTREFTYDINGLQTGNSVQRVINGQSITLQHTDQLDRNGRLIGSIDVLGNRIIRDLDASGNIESVTNASERVVMISGFDHPVPEQFSFSDQTQTSQLYDNNDNVIATIDQMGQVTRYSYDTRNNLVAIIRPDDTPSDDSDNPIVRYEYDSRGNQVASIDPLGNRTETDFDALGRRIAVRDAFGNETRYEYDALGNNTALIDPLQRRTRFTYDSRGNQVEIHLADGTVIQQEFDGMGNLLARTDGNGNVTRYSYSPAGDITRVLDAENGATIFEYDTYGNLTAETDANGNRIEHRYDDLSRRIAIIYPDGSTQRFNYLAHDLISQEDFAGDETSYEYDDVGRVVRTVFDDSSSQNDDYDAVGRLVSRTYIDSEGREQNTTWQYNEAGQLIGRTGVDGKVVNYQYDLVGNLTSIVNDSGTTVFSYDAANRLSTVVGSDGSMATYEYDSASQLVGLDYSNGLAEVRTYDQLGRLATQTVTQQGQILWELTYEYDADGNVVKQSRVEAGQLQERFFSFDRLNRLIEERFQIDGHAQPQRASQYEYDAVGNRLVKMQGNSRLQYSYDAMNRIVSQVHSDGNASITTTFEHNLNGQLIRQSDSNGGEQLLRWTPQGWLGSIEISDSVGIRTIEYSYSGDGLRARRVVRDAQDSTVESIGMVWNVVGEVPTLIGEYQEENEFLRVYTHGHEPIAIQESGSSRFYHQDVVGTTIAMTDSDGNIDSSYNVDAFGHMDDGRTFDQPIQFAGEFVDQATGWTYLRARDLDRSSGRFLSIDPQEGSLLDPMTRHDYVYAHSNPLRYTDPTGQTSVAEQVVTTAIYSTLALITLAGIQQVYAHTIGGTPVNWQGLTAAATVGATWGPDTGYQNWSIGLTGGAYLGLSLVASSPYTRAGEKQQSYGAALVHIGSYAGVGAGYSPFSVGLGVGSITVDVPGAQWLKNLGSGALAPFYALIADLNVSAGPGRTLHSMLWMGFGIGSASGMSFGNGVGVSLTFVGAITIPLPSIELTPSEFASWRYVVNDFS